MLTFRLCVRPVFAFNASINIVGPCVRLCRGVACNRNVGFVNMIIVQIDTSVCSLIDTLFDGIKYGKYIVMIM